jgi:hypothetical protein
MCQLETVARVSFNYLKSHEILVFIRCFSENLHASFRRTQANIKTAFCYVTDRIRTII